MHRLAQSSLALDPHQIELEPIVTTLGKVIEAINEEVDPEEDYLVARALSHLIVSGRVRFINSNVVLENLLD